MAIMRGIEDVGGGLGDLFFSGNTAATGFAVEAAKAAAGQTAQNKPVTSPGFGAAIMNLFNPLASAYIAQQEAKTANANARANQQPFQQTASNFGVSPMVLLGGVAVLGLVLYLALRK